MHGGLGPVIGGPVCEPGAGNLWGAAGVEQLMGPHTPAGGTPGVAPAAEPRPPAPPVLSISSSTLAQPAATAINVPAGVRASLVPHRVVPDPEPPDGFAAAFPELFALAYRVGYRVLGERGEAEDVAQEALARAVLRWPALADRPHGWVVRVAGNLAIDRYRRRRRTPLRAEVGVEWAEAGAADRLDLAASLARLPRRQRQVVVLRYLADWSERAVAEELGCSVGNVKSSGARAIRALRRHLGVDATGGRGGAAAP